MLVRMILLRHELKACSSMHNKKNCLGPGRLEGHGVVLRITWKGSSGKKTGVAEDHHIMGPGSSQHQFDRSRLGTVTLAVSLCSVSVPQ